MLEEHFNFNYIIKNLNFTFVNEKILCKFFTIFFFWKQINFQNLKKFLKNQNMYQIRLFLSESNSNLKVYIPKISSLPADPPSRIWQTGIEIQLMTSQKIGVSQLGPTFLFLCKFLRRSRKTNFKIKFKFSIPLKMAPLLVNSMSWKWP